MRIPGHDVEHNRKTRSHRSAGEVVTRIRSKTGAITQRSRVAPVTVSRVTYSSPIDCRAVSGWSSKPDRTWTRPRDNHLCSPVLAGRGKGHKCHRPRHHHNRSQPITTRRAGSALSLHHPTSHLCQFLNGFRFVAGVLPLGPEADRAGTSLLENRHGCAYTCRTLFGFLAPRLRTI